MCSEATIVATQYLLLEWAAQIKDCRTICLAALIGAQTGGSAFPDYVAIPMAAEGADGRPEEVCKASETARIYGMICTKQRIERNTARKCGV